MKCYLNADNFTQALLVMLVTNITSGSTSLIRQWKDGHRSYKTNSNQKLIKKTNSLHQKCAKASDI